MKLLSDEHVELVNNALIRSRRYEAYMGIAKSVRANPHLRQGIIVCDSRRDSFEVWRILHRSLLDFKVTREVADLYDDKYFVKLQQHPVL